MVLKTLCLDKFILIGNKYNCQTKLRERRGRIKVIPDLQTDYKGNLEFSDP